MRTALIVDDSAVVRTVARCILQNLSFTVSEAEDGDVAVAIIEHDLPDVILLDWQMPNMDGYTFLKYLRNLPNGHRSKVVFCSAEKDVISIGMALQAGADEYMMKPFTSEILRDKLFRLGLVKAGTNEISSRNERPLVGRLTKSSHLIDRFA